MFKSDAAIIAAIVVVGVLVLGAVGLASSSYCIIPSGHIGIVRSFGRYESYPITEGFSLKAPWKSVEKVSIRTSQHHDTTSAPTKQGLMVELDATLNYRLSPDKAVEVYRKYGPTYEEIIVRRFFRSCLRDATAHYEVNDLYGDKRSDVGIKIHKDLQAKLEPMGIIAEDVMLQDLKLPAAITEKIQSKIGAEQDSERMVYILAKERQESERKAVEAKGIADAQAIIKKDLNSEYLVYLWLETLKSNLGKGDTTIYIPTGSDGLPVFKQIAK